MPIYGYNCTHCDADFDLNKKISDRDVVGSETCPECATVGQIVRQVGSPLVAYSVTTAGGYGRIPDGFKQVLRDIDRKAGVRKANNTSSFL